MVIFSKFIFSQKIIIPTGKYSEVKQFLKSNTYLVSKSDFSGFAITMTNILKDFWTITPIKIISIKEFEKLKNDDKNSFLMIDEVYFDADKSKTKFDFLILTLGGNYKTIDDMPTLCAIPLCYADDESENYCYKLGLMLEFIQNHINICKNDPDINSDKILSIYKNKIKNLNTKTLYIIKDDISNELRNNSQFEKYYKYNFKFATTEEIEKLIANKDEKAVIMHRISNYGKKELSYSITILIDTKNADIYYYDIVKVSKSDKTLLQANDLENFCKGY